MTDKQLLDLLTPLIIEYHNVDPNDEDACLKLARELYESERCYFINGNIFTNSELEAKFTQLPDEILWGDYAGSYSEWILRGQQSKSIISIPVGVLIDNKIHTPIDYVNCVKSITDTVSNNVTVEEFEKDITDKHSLWTYPLDEFDYLQQNNMHAMLVKFSDSYRLVELPNRNKEVQVNTNQRTLTITYNQNNQYSMRINGQYVDIAQDERGFQVIKNNKVFNVNIGDTVEFILSTGIEKQVITFSNNSAPINVNSDIVKFYMPDMDLAADLLEGEDLDDGWISFSKGNITLADAANTTAQTNTPEINQSFIDKYSQLVSDVICVVHNVNINDPKAKAILAYNLLNPNNPIEYNTTSNMQVSLSVAPTVKSDVDSNTQVNLSVAPTVESDVNSNTQVDLSVALPIEFLYRFVRRDQLTASGVDLYDLILTLPTEAPSSFYNNRFDLSDHPYYKLLNEVFISTVEECSSNIDNVENVLLQNLKDKFSDMIKVSPGSDIDEKTIYHKLCKYNDLAGLCRATIRKRSSLSNVPNWNPVQFRRFIPAQFIDMYLDLRSALTDCLIPDGVTSIKRTKNLTSMYWFSNYYSQIMVADMYDYKICAGEGMYSMLKYAYNNICEINGKFYKLNRRLDPSSDKEILTPLEFTYDGTNHICIIGRNNLYTASSYKDDFSIAKGAIFTYIDFLTYYKNQPIPNEFSVDKVYDKIKYYEAHTSELANFIKNNLPLNELEDYRHNWKESKHNEVVDKFWYNYDENISLDVPSNYEIMSASDYSIKNQAVRSIIGKIILEESANPENNIFIPESFHDVIDNSDPFGMYPAYIQICSMVPMQVYNKYYNKYITDINNKSLYDNAINSEYFTTSIGFRSRLY